MPIDLPYFDEILARILATPHAELVRALGTRHVHWGYYADPASTDASTEGLLAAAEALTVRMVAAARVEDGGRILDAGCGFAGTIAHINEHYSDVDLIGLNLDQRQLARARELVKPRPGNRVSLVVGDACRMVFAPQAFDVVLAVESIFHFPSRRRFLAEARRVLSTGGRLVLSDFVPYGPAFPLLAPYVLLRGGTIRRFYGPIDYFRPCTMTGYRLLARATGFRLILDEDITANTLPTYPVVLRMLRDVGHREGQRATEYVEAVSRKGFVRYRILAFEALT